VKLYTFSNEEEKKLLVEELKKTLRGEKELGHLADDKSDDFDLNIEIQGSSSNQDKLKTYKDLC
jgi:hypothetical protein